MSRFQGSNNVLRVFLLLSDQHFITSLIFIGINWKTLPMSLYEKYFSTPSLLELFCLSLVHEAEKYRLISQCVCVFPFLQILKTFSNIVTNSDMKIKSLYTNMLQDHINSNNNMKNLRNFKAKEINTRTLIYWIRSNTTVTVWQFWCSFQFDNFSLT
jgi:hypothetical protein